MNTPAQPAPTLDDADLERLVGLLVEAAREYARAWDGKYDLPSKRLRDATLALGRALNAKAERVEI